MGGDPEEIESGEEGTANLRYVAREVGEDGDAAVDVELDR
jgi:hypothetical protein